MRLFGAATLFLVLTLHGFGCSSPCPAEHDPSANPGGRACILGDECRIECVCFDEGGTDDGVFGGACTAGVCQDADAACRDACGARSYAGKYCETRD